MNAPLSSQPIEAESQAPASYRFSFEPETRRVRAVYQGITIADSQQVMLLQETRIAPICYFPRDDVHMELFQRSEYVTYCPFKGNAAHYSLHTGEIVADNILWSYETPLDESAQITNYIAFYPVETTSPRRPVWPPRSGRSFRTPRSS